MKKIYVNPEMNVVLIKTQQMIAASPGFDPNEETTTMESRRRGRRRRDEWDDEEDWDEEDNF